MLIDSREELALDPEILDYRFYHPIDARDFREVIFEVARLHMPGQRGCEEGRGLYLLRGFQARVRDAVPNLRAVEGEAARLLSGRQLLRGDVEKQDFDPCIREMRGYLRAHRSRAQHSHSINLVTHFLSSVIAPIPPPLAF